MSIFLWHTLLHAPQKYFCGARPFRCATESLSIYKQFPSSVEFSTEFWFSKITRIAQNTTSITNRLKLLTPLVRTLLKSIPQNYCKLLLQREKQLQLPTF